MNVELESNATMSSKPTQTRRRVWLAVMLLGAVGLGGIFACRALYLRFDAWLDPWFDAADYPSLLAEGGWHRYGFPTTLPSEASNVVIYAPDSAPSPLQSPDQHVEVRFILPPAQAIALLNSVGKPIQGSIKVSEYVDHLHQLPTPLPPEFQHFLLKNPSGMNVGGVSVNPTTGEVVYWIIEF